MPDPIEPSPARTTDSTAALTPASPPAGLNERVGRLESGWRQGARPDLDGLLAGLAGPERTHCLAELALVELELRLKAGEAARVEDYLTRFPELRHEPKAVRELAAAEFHLRRRLEPDLDTTEFAHRFPNLSPADWREGGGPEPAGPPVGPAADRYELLGELGRGGVGSVLRARDRHLGRDLAVKVLLDRHRANPSLRRRFLDEARVAGRLQHPGVAPVYELGELSDGRPFISMKLVEGRTLLDLLKERPDPAHDLSRFLHVFEQVCQAVAYAHSKGVIHRDLKPANVMVGAFGEVQVMDWGLAKVLPASGGASAPRFERAPVNDSRSPRGADAPPLAGETALGAVIGTPAYMAPEQARGAITLLDERADVFGLGAVLCEILTGRPPFLGSAADALLRSGVGDLGGALARLGACGAEAELTDLARRCLAPERDDRPRDAGAVAGEVAAYRAEVVERLRQAELAGAAERARADEARAKLRAERRARRLTAGLAAAVLLAGGLAAGGGLWVQAERAARERQELAAGRRQAEAEAGSRAALEEAVAALRRQDWPAAGAALERAEGRLGPGGPADLRDLLVEARADLALAARLDQARLKATTVVNNVFDVGESARGYAAAFRDRGLDVLGAAAADRLAGSAVRDPVVAALDEWSAYALDDKSLRDRLMAVARAVDPDPWRDRFRSPAVRDDPAELRRLADDAPVGRLRPATLTALSFVLWRAGVEDLPLVRRAQKQHPQDYWLNERLGRRLGVEARQRPPADARLLRAEAVGYYRAALAQRPASSGTLNNLGLALAELDQPAEAEECFRAAVRHTPDYSGAYFNLGLLLQKQGRTAEALAELERAASLHPDDAEYRAARDGARAATARRAAAAGLGQWTAAARQALRPAPGATAAALARGNALLGTGKPVEAEAEFREALRLRPDDPEANVQLGTALAAQSRPAAAAAAFREALRHKPDFARARMGLCLALMAVGDHAAAVEAGRQAVGAAPRSAEAHCYLGMALAGRGAPAEAEAAFREALRLSPDYAEAHLNLASALRAGGRFADSLDSFRRAHEVGARRPGWHYPSARYVQEAERLVSLDARLPAVAAGAARPADDGEWLEFAEFALRHKRQAAAAARWYAEAFARKPALAVPGAGHRYSAGCAAALAGAGATPDAARLPDRDRAALRRRALALLRGEYDFLAGQAAIPAARPNVRQALTRWLTDPDLSGVRAPFALAKLPADERDAWRDLWAAVVRLLALLLPPRPLPLL